MSEQERSANNIFFDLLEQLGKNIDGDFKKRFDIDDNGVLDKEGKADFLKAARRIILKDRSMPVRIEEVVELLGKVEKQLLDGRRPNDLSNSSQSSVPLSELDDLKISERTKYDIVHTVLETAKERVRLRKVASNPIDVNPNPDSGMLVAAPAPIKKSSSPESPSIG